MTEWSVIENMNRSKDIKESKKRFILKATANILTKKDFDKITIDDIAEKAGVAKGTVYIYFENKEDLLISVFEDMTKDLENSIASIETVKPSLYLKEVIREELKFLKKNCDAISKFLVHKYSLVKLRVGLKKIFKDHLDFVAGLIKERMMGLDIRGNDYLGFTMNMLFLCKMYQTKKWLTGDNKDLLTYSDEISEILLKGWSVR